MGIFRRLFFLGRPLRALTWYHVCITYSEDTLEFYLNGDLQGSQAGRPEYPVGGTRLKVGAWDAVRSFSGEITEVLGRGFRCLGRQRLVPRIKVH